MNGDQINFIEYYYGHFNAGCHLKVNHQRVEEMASGPEPKEPPAFLRGQITTNFEGHLKYTDYLIFNQKLQVWVPIRVTWNLKTLQFSIKHGEKG